MKTRIVGVLLIGAVALLALSTEALAADITMSQTGVWYGGGTNDRPCATAHFPGGIQTASARAGLLQFHEQGTDVGDFFYLFCIELVEFSSGSYLDYTWENPSDAPVSNGSFGTMGSGGQSAMEALFATDSFLGMTPEAWGTPGIAATDAKIYGFQLAIWEIVYEYAYDDLFSMTDLNVSSGDFYFTNAGNDSFVTAAMGYATTALGQAQTATGGWATAWSNDGAQDFIEGGGGSDDPASPTVPLPPAALGGLFLLGGLAAGRRRRKNLAE